MNRFYLPPDEWQVDCLTLVGDEAKHCSRVMRAKQGDMIEIFDGIGNAAYCIVESVQRDQVSCRIESKKTSPLPTHPITLCQAIPKGANMDLIVQKAVELGVSAIQPLISAHTVARPESAAKKRVKWQRIALEASKQCGQNHLPAILEPADFSAWLAKQLNFDLRLIAALDQKALHLNAYLSKQLAPGNIALLIGPEGDFSADEYEACFKAGFHPISFGNIVLRVETAAIYGLSVLHHELSEI